LTSPGRKYLIRETKKTVGPSALKNELLVVLKRGTQACKLMTTEMIPGSHFQNCPKPVKVSSKHLLRSSVLTMIPGSPRLYSPPATSLKLAEVDQFVERFGDLPEEQKLQFACRLISNLQQHDLQIFRNIVAAFPRGESKKRGCSEVASEGNNYPSPFSGRHLLTTTSG
jgi:hypothetical protein